MTLARYLSPPVPVDHLFLASKGNRDVGANGMAFIFVLDDVGLSRHRLPPAIRIEAEDKALGGANEFRDLDGPGAQAGIPIGKIAAAFTEVDFDVAIGTERVDFYAQTLGQCPAKKNSTLRLRFGLHSIFGASPIIFGAIPMVGTILGDRHRGG